MHDCLHAPHVCHFVGTIVMLQRKIHECEPNGNDSLILSECFVILCSFSHCLTLQYKLLLDFPRDFRGSGPTCGRPIDPFPQLLIEPRQHVFLKVACNPFWLVMRECLQALIYCTLKRSRVAYAGGNLTL